MYLLLIFTFQKNNEMSYFVYTNMTIEEKNKGFHFEYLRILPLEKRRFCQKCHHEFE